MKSRIAKIILISMTLVVLCSIGLFSNTLTSSESEQLSQCCNNEIIAFHAKEISNGILYVGNFIPALFIFVISFGIFFYKENAVDQTIKTPYYFHKFSRGIFQLE